MKALPRIGTYHESLLERTLHGVADNLHFLVTNPFSYVALAGGVLIIVASRFVLNFILPIRFYIGEETSLSLPTRIMVELSSIVINRSWLILLGIIGIVSVCSRYLMIRPRRIKALRWVWPLSLFCYLFILGLALFCFVINMFGGCNLVIR